MTQSISAALMDLPPPPPPMNMTDTKPVQSWHIQITTGWKGLDVFAVGDELCDPFRRLIARLFSTGEIQAPYHVRVLGAPVQKLPIDRHRTNCAGDDVDNVLFICFEIKQ